MFLLRMMMSAFQRAQPPAPLVSAFAAANDLLRLSSRPRPRYDGALAHEE